MLFNSLSFALFLPVVFILHWFVAKDNFKLQNKILLASSYFFYGYWDYRFLCLLAFSTLLDFLSGKKIYAAQQSTEKKFWLWLSIAVNLGFLCIFKYYNFFTASFESGLSLFGIHSHFQTLNVIIPIGISFYTFHGLSYVIDIYKQRITPEKNFLDYSLFVSFFPLLVAGPIERATHLLPQLIKKREFEYTRVVNGLRQILWGLFKKIAIADNCGKIADSIFGSSTELAGSTIALGALFFTIQIYCDFSGYSDIAIGTARLFGIDLLRNFAFPYFSRDIAEFWRRWHISLTSWFRDYLYIPLGGSKVNTFSKIRNVFLVFLVSGFWHGANWTFIAWGLLNAFFILPSILFKTNRNSLDVVAKGKIFPSLKEFFSMVLTFSLTVFAWIFFRASDMNQAIKYISEIFSESILSTQDFSGIENIWSLVIIIIFFFVTEWFGREQQYAIEKLGLNWSKPIRWAMYYGMIFIIYTFAIKGQPFIYYQF